MCGIAGAVGCSIGRVGLEAALVRTQAALAHRGPDGSGIWLAPDGTAGLAHTRLAIIDLSQGAAQPMSRSGCHLVFNGEIYNFRHLFPEDPVGGDTEALHRWLISKGSLASLAGMFAFGLYQESDRSLVLARDPLGIKPLYFAETTSGFVFASEVRAILASGLVEPRADPQAIAAYFQTGSVPEPLTCIRGISCLPAGHVLERSREGNVHIREIDPGAPEAEVGVSEALAESCRRHLVSDVPVGVFLSGGTDSAAVARLATLEGQVTEAFSLIFAEQAFSEEPQIRSAASAMGLKLHLKSLGRDDARALFPKFLAAQDQPSVDGFNTFCISHFAREKGFRVVLSGLGGDELFGGYPSFHTVPAWATRAAVVPQQVRRPAGQMLESLARNGKLRRVAAWLQEQAGLASSYQLVRGLFSPVETKFLLSHFGIDGAVEPWANAPCDGWHDPREGVACLEATRYMRNQLLRDSDAMSMAHGLELRLPLVDARLWSQVRRMLADRRFAPGKAALRELVPSLEAIVPASPKRGFTLPLQEWLDDSWCSYGEASGIGRRLDLSHWSRKMALISLGTYLRTHGIRAS